MPESRRKSFLKKMSIRSLLLFSMLTLSSYKPQGEPPAMDFTDFISRFDLSKLWLPGKIITGIKKDTLRPEPTGFIDSSHAPFYIHLLTVYKSNENPFLYYAYGKAMAYGAVMTVEGTFTVKEAKLYEENTNPKYRQGYVTGEYDLRETVKEKKGDTQAGELSGHFRTNFLWEDQYDVYYDALGIANDSFSNNQFEGSWIGAGGMEKLCNWGDFKAPGQNASDSRKTRIAGWWE